ncbi:MAG TPA: hypothetical protein VNE63_07560 [Candidatus Acidoferrales bacterium]|nr:hypothetical protein [Candidatus Acidoferrales bacterium]
MAQSILIFDFGTNEEAAQQARHKVEGWQQGFRLGKKILLKFDREEPAEAGAGRKDEQDQAAEGKEPGEKKSAAVAEKNAGERIRLLIRLDFSGHEKLSQQQWLNRIPSEEPFKSAKGETIHHNDAAFVKAAERFDSLD